MQKPVVIAFVGCHQEGALCIPELYKAGHKISLIITLKCNDLKKKSGALDYQSIADQFDIPLLRVSSINAAASINSLRELSPDVMCVIGWSELLLEPVLDTARVVLGAHASLLPQMRGSAPVNWALIKGMSVTGNTLMVLNPGIDTGDIVDQEKINISRYDSCATLYDRVGKSNSRMLLRALEQIVAGELVGKKQPRSVDDSVLPRRKPADGLINWELDCIAIYNFIRALTRPYPGAYTYLDGQEIKVWKASLAECDSGTSGPEGSVANRRYSFESELCAIDIYCGTGVISLHQLELLDGSIVEGAALLEKFPEKFQFDRM